MPTVEQMQRLSDAHRDGHRRIRARAEAHVADRWKRLGSYRDRDINRFVGEVVPVVLGAQQQVAALTDSYLATVTAAKLGGPARPAGVPAREVTGAAVRNGTTPQQTYRRPGVTVWTELDKGTALDVAIARGGQRAIRAVATDLQLTRTHTARRVLSRDSRAYGYRRVPKGAETCAMCLIASTQGYRRGDLMPIHPGCDCDVEPVYSAGEMSSDTGRVDEIHAAVQRDLGAADAGGRRPDYRQLLVTREHGEYGPVLTLRRHRFTGPAEI